METANGGRGAKVRVQMNETSRGVHTHEDFFFFFFHSGLNPKNLGGYPYWIWLFITMYFLKNIIFVS